MTASRQLEDAMVGTRLVILESKDGHFGGSAELGNM